VRAVIDVEKLNAYLKARVPEVSAPVTVKQFKVCVQQLSHSRRLAYGYLDSVWTGTLCRSTLLQVPDVLPSSQIRPTFSQTQRTLPCHIHRNCRVYRPLYSRGKKFVLRKKPAGQLLSSTAHQVEREYRVLNALHKHNVKSSTPPEKRVPVPQPYILCEDNAVIGTPFYVMEFLDGRIFTDVYMPQLDPKDRREWCVLLLLDWPWH